jgi:hypothetical protein
MKIILSILILITSIITFTIVPYIIGRYIMYKEKPKEIMDIFFSWIIGILFYMVIFIIIILYQIIYEKIA